MTDPTPEQQLAALRRKMGSLAGRGPTGDQIADWNTADRAMAERIHTARPGLPLHHVYAVLQTLRSVTWLEETGGGGPSAEPELDCPHCPDGHTPPDRGSQPWSAWVSSERDGDGQPMQITVARSAGAHVAESDAQWVRERLNGKRR